MQRADVHRDVIVALRNRIAFGIMQRVRKVSVVDHKGVTGAQHLLGHLVNGCDEGVLENFKRDGI